MITLGQMLTLSAILFALSVAGIFLNRKNVLLLLMCIELLLLSARLRLRPAVESVIRFKVDRFPVVVVFAS